MIKIYPLIALFALISTAQAAPVRRLYQDVKLPSQVMLEKQTVTAPAVGNTALILNAVDGPTSTAAITVTSFSAQPDVPRNLIMTATGTANDISATTVRVNGTNIFGASIFEDFTIPLHSHQVSITGNHAFKTVTSVVFPANAENGAFGGTWNLGTGSKLGLKRCMSNAGDFFHAELNGVKEATAPTVNNSTVVDGNTVTLNSALNGTDVILFFVQSFSCFP